VIQSIYNKMAMTAEELGYEDDSLMDDDDVVRIGCKKSVVKIGSNCFWLIREGSKKQIMKKRKLLAFS